MIPAPPISDPAAAVAAAKCALARQFPRVATSVAGVETKVIHPRECEWCFYPPADLVRMVEAFNVWAQDPGDDVEEDPRTYGAWAAPSVVSFRRLPLPVQRRAVAIAQYGNPEAEA